MKVIEEKDINKLLKEGKVFGEDGEKIKLAMLPKKITVPKVPTEERQMQILEKITSETVKAFEANNKNAAILLEMIRRTKLDVKMPEFPEPVKRWNFDVVRNNEGYIKSITAEAK